MGKQIRFFQTEGGEEEMFRFLSRIGLNVYPVPLSESSERPIKKLSKYEEFAFLKSRLCLLTHIELYDEIGSLERFGKNPTPAIEYSLCNRNMLTNASMNYARFWLNSELYDCLELKKYYNKLACFVKKEYLYCPSLQTYMCKDTFEKWRTGRCVLHIGKTIFEYEKIGSICPPR